MPEFWIATEGATAADDALCGPFPSPTKAEEYKERVLNGLGKVIAEGSADVLASQKWPRIKPLPLPPKVDPRANLDAYLLAIDQSGMTYANAQQARQDLILFGARPLLHAIEERLSMDDILPRGRHVHFAVEDYLAEFMPTETPPADPTPADIEEQAA